MFIVDDILLFPVTSVFWLFRQIHGAVTQEASAAPERIAAELTDLYMLLETGAITEAEFEERERVLLDMLDALEGGSDDEEDQGEDEDWDDASDDEDEP